MSGDKDQDYQSLQRTIAELQVQNERLKDGLREALDLAGHYGPEPSHKGSCGPEAGCDGGCQDAAYFGERFSRLAALLL